MSVNPAEYQGHPLVDPFGLRIETPAIKTLQDFMLQCLWNDTTGAVIQGSSRCGKTTAIELVTPRLVDRTKSPLPYHVFTVPKRDVPTINSLYRVMTFSLNLPLKQSMRVEHMLNNILHAILDACAKRESKIFTLIVDEGQRLSIEQCNVFVELYDILRSQFNIALTVFFFMNSNEATTILETVKEEEYQHIYGRFFRTVTDFKGLTSHNDVKFCLKQLDSLRFPDKTGPTYTEYFTADAFAKGWRLTECSVDLWQTFSDYKRQFKLKHWPMHYFIQTVRTLLVDFIPYYGIEAINEEMVQEAIKVSGLIPSLVKPV